MSALSEAIGATLSQATGAAFEIGGRWIAWPQVAVGVAAVRTALDALELPPGARIGFIARNRLGPAVALIAILAGDLCAVPLNPFQSEGALAGDIEGLALAVLIGDAGDLQSPRLLQAAGAAGVLAVDIETPQIARVLKRPAFTDAAARAAGDCALLLPTSGTTGAPKRIPIRAASWHATLTANPSRGVAIQYSPLAHIAGALAVSGAAVRGSALVLLEKFTVEDWVGAIGRHRPKVANLPPTMMRMLMTAAPDPEDLASLDVVLSGQAPVDWDLARAFEQTYGVIVCGNYGATEFCGPIAAGSAELRKEFGESKWGSVGRVRRDLANVRVVDAETGGALAAGEIGVLEVQVFRMGDHWMRTSDLAAVDADDFLYIHGRADDAILRGGFKIVPSVIADVLMRYPGVAEVAVAGRPDERLGAVPVAAVEMVPGAPPPTEAELIAFARASLLSYQVPVAVRVVDALPRTPTLKADRRAVLALF